MNTSSHILAKEGILTTFSIAKKITVRDMKKLCSKMKSSKINEEKFQKLLMDTVMKETQNMIEAHKIPGLITDEMFSSSEEKKRMMELTYFSSIIAKKLTEKNIDKYHSCFIINAVVNLLQLTEEDFSDFHRRFSKLQNGEDENGDIE